MSPAVTGVRVILPRPLNSSRVSSIFLLGRIFLVGKCMSNVKTVPYGHLSRKRRGHGNGQQELWL